ncbi:MAG: hypothetical protein ACI8ZM_004692 [Crocinitomix sp.]|jgi:hypothetical protein
MLESEEKKERALIEVLEKCEQIEFIAENYPVGKSVEHTQKN